MILGEGSGMSGVVVGLLRSSVLPLVLVGKTRAAAVVARVGSIHTAMGISYRYLCVAGACCRHTFSGEGWCQQQGLG